MAKSLCALILVCAALITGTTDITAGSLTIQVSAAEASSYAAQATAGLGSASNVGFAGALAINVVDTSNTASIAADSVLTLHGNVNVTVEAISNVAITTKAIPAGENGGDASKIGVGASVALGYGQDTTTAYIGDNAAIRGAKNLSLNAQSTHQMDTEATGGGKGGTALTPVVAISISNNETHATLGANNDDSVDPLTISGNFSASSTLTNNVQTSATGDTQSSGTGVGVSLGISVVQDHSLVTTLRNFVSTSGSIAFMSSLFSNSQSKAKASGAGGESDDGSGEHDNSDSQSVDNTISKQKDFASKIAKEKGSATAASGAGDKAPSASTSDGSVSVAGAVAVNVEEASASASLPDGVSVKAGGALSLKSQASGSGSAEADGSAVQSGESGDGVGAAVAVNYGHVINAATIGAASVQAGSIELEASNDSPDSFSASATSGAGGGNIGVAGSLALNLGFSETRADIGGSGSAASVSVGGGSISQKAGASVSNSASATPSAGGGVGGNLGIGLSVAVNYSENSVSAQVAEGSSVSGAGDLSQEASLKQTMATVSKAGAKGKKAFTPVVGVSVTNNSVQAGLESGPALSIGGNLSASASVSDSVSSDVEGSALSEADSIPTRSHFARPWWVQKFLACSIARAMSDSSKSRTLLWAWTFASWATALLMVAACLFRGVLVLME